MPWCCHPCEAVKSCTLQFLTTIKCLLVTKVGSHCILHHRFFNKTIQKPLPKHRVIGLLKACSHTESRKPNTTYHASQDPCGDKFLDNFNLIIYFSHFLRMTALKCCGYNSKSGYVFSNFPHVHKCFWLKWGKLKNRTMLSWKTAIFCIRTLAAGRW